MSRTVQPASAQGVSMEMKDVALPLYQAKGWIRFLGVMMIIVGALYAVTIIGLLFAWLPIWLGVLLFQASSRIEYAYEGGGAVSFMESLQKLKTYFIINGVVVLISLIFVGVGALAGILGGLAGFMS
ncbi:MAG: hypothetical protein F4X98_09405 [Gammaproteobacteria bacterium]|nr:hypothetical protein [Gammaproteobacteria bacterium]